MATSHQYVSDATPHVPCADDGNFHYSPSSLHLSSHTRLISLISTRAVQGLLRHLCTMRHADFRERLLLGTWVNGLWALLRVSPLHCIEYLLRLRRVLVELGSRANKAHD